MDFDQDNDVSYPKWERISFAVGVGIVFVGIILKYNNFHVSRYFLLTGIGIGLLSFFIGFFFKDKTEEKEEDEVL